MKQTKINNLKKNKSENLKFFAFTSPWIVGFLLLIIIPLLGSFYISFTEWKILDKPVFVGLDNYREIFQDPLIYKSLKVTFIFTLINVPVSMIITFFIALLLNTNFRYNSLFRTIYYLPSVVSGTATAMLWVWLFNHKFGVINRALFRIGIEGPAWLSDESWALYTLILMSLWGAGSGIMLYLSGFKLVNNDFHEIAILSGASFWDRLKNITIPAMSPVLLFAFLTGVINGLQSFTSSFITTGGGPNNATMFYALYLYNNAFKFRKMGKACAMAWLLFVVIFVMSILILKVSKKMVYYGNNGDSE